MSGRSLIAIFALSAVTLVASAGAQRALTQVSYADVCRTVEITGSFGQPLGKSIAIEGRVLGDDEVLGKGRNESLTPLLVTKVNGVAVREPFYIECILNEKQFPEGTSVRLHGYETGEMAGETEAEKDYWRKRNMVHQSRSYHFRLKFIDLEAVRLEGPKVPYVRQSESFKDVPPR